MATGILRFLPLALLLAAPVCLVIAVTKKEEKQARIEASAVDGDLGGAQVADSKAHDEAIKEDALKPEVLHRVHKKIDANKDGKMTKAEVLDFASKIRESIAKKDISMILEAMDSDKDGRLSLAEVTKGVFDVENKPEDGNPVEMEDRGITHQKELDAEKFDVADENKDGQLDLEELPGLFYPETNHAVLHVIVVDVMKQKDKDGDGVLNPREFWSIPDGEEVSDNAKADFDKFDTDASGSLSLAELTEWESGRLHMKHAVDHLFKVADKDGDMHVSVDELGRVGDAILGTDAHYHMQEWADHEL